VIKGHALPHDEIRGPREFVGQGAMRDHSVAPGQLAVVPSPSCVIVTPASSAASEKAHARYLFPFLVFPRPLRLPLLIQLDGTLRQYELKLPALGKRSTGPVSNMIVSPRMTPTPGIERRDLDAGRNSIRSTACFSILLNIESNHPKTERNLTKFSSKADRKPLPAKNATLVIMPTGFPCSQV
jgi:hypothetical protein